MNKNDVDVLQHLDFEPITKPCSMPYKFKSTLCDGIADGCAECKHCGKGNFFAFTCWREMAFRYKTFKLDYFICAECNTKGHNISDVFAFTLCDTSL